MSVLHEFFPKFFPNSKLIRKSPISENKTGIEKKYYELIMAVGNKYPNESRHETALKYIKRAEGKWCCPACRYDFSNSPYTPAELYDESFTNIECPDCNTKYTS